MKISFRLLLVLISAFFAIPAQALVEINVNNSQYSPLPIIITDFVSLDRLGAQFSEVIVKDLKTSGMFSPIPQSSLKQKNTHPDNVPRFAEWKNLGSQLLVMGRVVQEGKNGLRVDWRLWDIAGGTQIFGKKYFSPRENWRRIAHTVSDEIHRNITGEKACFDTSVLFVSETITEDSIERRLCMMDYDGFNVRCLTPNNGPIVLEPNFLPKHNKVAYVSYDNDNLSKVYILNLKTDRGPERVGNFRGMVFAPSFSSDGKYLIMSVQKEEGIDIYSVNLYLHSIKRLTDTSFINTSPSYSPDSARIVFESDRDGIQQLYVMNSDGSNQHRISPDLEASYADPVWSPRGNLVAFTKISEGNFSIGVMGPDGSKERILTKGFYDQKPTWSPNGRFLMFSRKNKGDKGSRFYSIDLNGRNETLINTPAYASDANWSQYFPYIE